MAARTSNLQPQGSAYVGLGRWTVALLIYCVAVIVFGGFVSSSLSGDGCGMHWPSCHGSLLPDGTLKSAIEISHRYSSAVLLFFVLGVLYAARTVLPKGHAARKWLAWAVAFCVTEALVGAVLVKTGWVAKDTSSGRVGLSMFHLLNTFCLIGFLALAVDAVRVPRPVARGSSPTRWALIAGALALLALGATGAVASLGDQIFPASSLAAGLRDDLNPASHFLVRLRGIHPFVAVSGALYVLAMVGLVGKWCPEPVTRRRGLWLLCLVGLQIVLGVVNLALLAPLPLQSAHLLLTDAIWITFVLFAASAYRAEAPVPGEAESSGHPPTVRDFVALTKPRVISLLLFTTFAAMFVGKQGSPSWGLIVAVMIGGYLMAGAANTINMILERDLDDAMGRTSTRPTVTGRVSPRSAAWFATYSVAASLALLGFGANWLTAGLAFAGLLCYVLVYTIWLKRRSWSNIVIGGAAGAFPPLVGYAAVTGQLSPLAWYLFSVIFLWTPVHFWALALLLRDDYARAGVPMLPVVKGEHATVVQIAFYCVLTSVVSILPFLQREVGWFYLATTAVLNLWLLAGCVRLLLKPEKPQARFVFKASMVYLALFFIAVAVDRTAWPL